MKLSAKVIYDDIKDRELLNSVDSKFPVFIEYINFNTVNGRKEAYKIKSHWAAIKNPFVLLTDGDNVVKVFYSDAKGDSAIQQFVNYLNNDSKN